MKKLILSIIILLFAVGQGWTGSSRQYPKAYVVHTMCASGCDYNDITTWEAATDVNLTSLTTVDVESASGQKVLSIASTTPLGTAFKAGDTIFIDEGGADEEPCLIDSVNAGVSVTCDENLVNTQAVDHTISAGVVLEIEAASYSEDYLDMNGATTSADYYRVVKPDSQSKHKGIPLSDGSIVEFHGTSGSSLFTINENYSQIWDIAGKITDNDASYYYVFNIRGDESKCIGCLAYDSNNTGTGKNSGFYVSGALGESVYIINSLAIGNESHGFASVQSDNYLYNCTAVSNLNGFYQSTGTATAVNCASSSNTNDWDGSWSKTTCTAEDATPVYVDSGNDDFHLDTSDTVCIGNGTDPMTLGVNPFDDDVDGQPIRVGFDIGFDATDREPVIPTFPTVTNTGSTYYVDKDCGTPGNGTADDCDGDADDQIATIAGGIAAMSAGDTLVIHEGATAYAEDISITKNGSTTEWTIIEGAPGERPEINDSGDTVINITNGSNYVCMRNFDFVGGYISTQNTSSNIVLDDLDIDATGKTHAIKINNTINSTGTSDVWVRNVTAYSSNDSVIQIYARANNVVIDRCTLYSGGDDGINDHLAYSTSEPWQNTGPPIDDDDSIKNIYVINSKVYSNTNDGIDLIQVRGETVIKDTMVYDNVNSGIKVWGKEVWLTRNVVYSNDSSASGASGVYIKPLWEDSTYYLRSNLIANNGPDGGAGADWELRVGYLNNDYALKSPEIHMYNNVFVGLGQAVILIDGVNCLHDNNRCFFGDANYYIKPSDDTDGVFEWDGAEGSDHTFTITEMGDGTWAAASGMDTNARSSLGAWGLFFADAASDDYIPVNGSEICFGGTAISGYNTRIDPTSSWPDDVRTWGSTEEIGAYGCYKGARLAQ